MGTTIKERISLVLAMAVSVLPVAYLVNHIVPEPYMDEVFHVPQAQKYCEFDFLSWDPMITTFPGLYLCSVAYALAVYPWTQFMGSCLCTPIVLRSVNILFSLICSLLFREILVELDPKRRTVLATLKAFVFSLYPLHWFFSFLFYTDIGSTAAVMAMYLACLKGAYWTSSIFAAAGIMFRQTNVVWAAFTMCVGILQVLQTTSVLDETDENGKNFAFTEKESIMDQSNLRKRHGTSLRSRSNEPPLMIEQAVVSEKEDDFFWCQGFVNLACKTWMKRCKILWNFFPFMIVILLFILFVILNGSIVVGAKDAHKASPHLAQPLYFGVIATGALAPLHFNSVQFCSFFRFLRRGKLISFSILTLSSLAAFCCVHFFSLAHPYLLADNRHYPFYIWKKVIRSHWSNKYALIPLYVYSWWSIIYALHQKARVHYLWIFAFCIGIAAVLIPAPLIEFRYFTVPFFLIALHTNGNTSLTILILIAAQFVIVNIITMYLFLFKPFTWSHEPGVQRFIW